jgi:hypothetical protein
MVSLSQLIFLHAKVLYISIPHTFRWDYRTPTKRQPHICLIIPEHMYSTTNAKTILTIAPARNHPFYKSSPWNLYHIDNFKMFCKARQIFLYLICLYNNQEYCQHTRRIFHAALLDTYSMSQIYTRWH